MRVLAIASFLMTVLVLTGQHSINGTIHTIDHQVPITGATVVLLNTTHAVITDLNGTFQIENIEEGSYEIEITSVGFTSIRETIKIDQNITHSFYLEEKIFSLPGVVVESLSMTGGLGGVRKSLGSAHYIDQKEIQKFSYSDINRTLRNIPGANIQEEDGYGLRPNIGLRATGSERSSKITVMEDGILSAPAPYAAPAAYYFPSIGRMEAIEIQKGGSQIKYGPYTTGGAINLISTPIPTQFSGHADFITGSNNYKMLHANLGNAHKNVSYLVETLQYSADGFKQLDNGGNTGFDKEDYLVKVRVNTNPDAKIYQSLTLKMGQAEEASNETYLGLTDEDFGISPLRRYAGSQKDLMTTKHNQYALSHFVQLSDHIDIYSSIYRSDFARNWYKLDKVDGSSIATILENPDNYQEQMNAITGIADGSSLNVKANNRSYYSQGVQSNLVYHTVTNGVKHQIDFGIRYHEDQIDRFQWVDEYSMIGGNMALLDQGTPGTESNRISNARALSSHLQYKIEKNRFTITAGARYENITLDRNDFGKEDPERNGQNASFRENRLSVFIPGLAASYTIGEESQIFGGIHKGFAPPGSTEGALPEESLNFEFGWRTDQSRLTGQILGFYNDYSNLLGTDLAAAGGSGSQDLFNGGAATALGIEAGMTYQILGNNAARIQLPLSLTYTFSEATFNGDFESDFDAWGNVQAGDLLPYVPQHQLSATLSFEHKKVLADINARYSSAMLTQAGSFEAEIPVTDEAFTIDFALNYRLTKELSAFVNVNNLTNNIYIVSRRPAGVRPNLPRVFNLGLKANF